MSFFTVALLQSPVRLTSPPVTCRSVTLGSSDTVPDSLRKAKAAVLQSAGQYDMMTFPFSLDMQEETDVVEYFEAERK